MATDAAAADADRDDGLESRNYLVVLPLSLAILKGFRHFRGNSISSLANRNQLGLVKFVPVHKGIAGTFFNQPRTSLLANLSIQLTVNDA